MDLDRHAGGDPDERRRHEAQVERQDGGDEAHAGRDERGDHGRAVVERREQQRQVGERDGELQGEPRGEVRSEDDPERGAHDPGRQHRDPGAEVEPLVMLDVGPRVPELGDGDRVGLVVEEVRADPLGGTAEPPEVRRDRRAVHGVPDVHDDGRHDHHRDGRALPHEVDGRELGRAREDENRHPDHLDGREADVRGGHPDDQPEREDPEEERGGGLRAGDEIVSGAHPVQHPCVRRVMDGLDLRNHFVLRLQTVAMPTNSASPDGGPKFVFVTGGVMSGLGKGITAASTGRLLENAGFDVTAVKIDPYLNVDAGTMNPYQHGEVYVLNDGGEVDLDLGNYERFLDEDMSFDQNITTGKLYKNVIEKERAGDYLGKTVQIIPHITDDIKRRIREAAAGHDVCLIEVGGTVGDIEGGPYYEAIRQFTHEENEEDVLLAHVTLVPFSKNGEQKTKPTQHSVKELRSIGLQPDIVVGRCEEKLDPDTKEKIALFCDVPREAVFSNPDVEDIYHVPLVVEEEGLDEHVMERLDIEDAAQPAAERAGWWRDVVTREKSGTVKVALVGKYALEDAYLSIHEALKHAGLEHGVEVEVLWVDAEEMANTHQRRVREADAIVVPGGFGTRGTREKIDAARYARENEVPYLGLCLGFQMAVIEYARNVLGLEGAHSTEMVPETPHPVIGLLPEQYDVEDLGGTMRLGAHATEIQPGTLAAELYGESCTERHRHRYEVNPEYIDDLEAEGLRFSGRANNRMEVLELDDHPFFFGTQFHPEFRSRPGRASPPFVGLLDAAIEKEPTETTEVEV